MMMEGARSLGEYGMVPERYQDAVRAGIGFFECRLRMKNKWGQGVQGPFDVSVREIESGPIDANGDSKYQIKWITDPLRPAVRFQPNSTKSEISVAFIVDDPGWYNRVLIADPLNSAYRVVAYHSRGGIVPVQAIESWFECLREMLWKKFPMYNVIGSDKTLIENFRVEAAAKECVALTDPDNGKLLHPRSRIVVTEVWDKTEETKKMIQENRGLLRGWTDAVEFKTVIRPKVEEMIKERTGGSEPKGLSTPKTLQEIMRMSPEEKKALRQFLMADDEPVNAAAPAYDTRKMVSLRSNKTFLKRGDLIARAKELKIVNPEALPNREALIEAIVVAQNGDAMIPYGPQTRAPEPVLEPEPEPEVVT